MCWHRIKTGLAGPMLIVAISVPWVLVGCTTAPILPASKPQVVVPAPDADIAALVTIVEDVYRLAGGGRMIFLEANEPADRLQRAMSYLQCSLNTRVRPESEATRAFDDTHPIMTPIDRDTGEVGISILVGDFAPDELGRLRMGVSYARSGLDGEILQYVLQRTDAGWSVLEVIQVAIA